ncbi:unnamed protein product, partial [Porites evermanni]
ISCRAAVTWEAAKPAVIETVEVAPPKASEVRIKMINTGVCHSDSTMASGNKGDFFPVVLGHEGSGVVESVGEGVTTVKPGDHVVLTWVLNCGECKLCQNPLTNLCSSFALDKAVLLDGTTRMTCKGKSIKQLTRLGTFSEYIVVPEILVVKIPQDVPLDKACLLGCCVTTGYGAAINTAKVKPGSSVAVWGLGGVGLSAVMGCKAAGAARIIGIDIKPDKFPLAKELGCTECMNPKDYDKPIQQVLTEMTEGGLDFTIECIGNIATMRAAFESSHVGWGTTVIVGVAQEQLSVNPDHLLMGKNIIGSLFGGMRCVASEIIPKLSQEYMAGKLSLEKLITHTMPLDKINEAFDVMFDGKRFVTK